MSRRLSEVEIHHVDLAAGYQPVHWPGWFVADRLESAAAEFAGHADMPSARLVVTGASNRTSTSTGGTTSTGGDGGDGNTGQEYRIGPADASGAAAPEPRISGPGWLLLAWLTGRNAGEGLTADPAGPLPALPAW